jgi:hypothetical protein
MIFKTNKIYLQVFRDKIIAVNLVTGERVVENAVESFSSIRQTIGHFNNANATLKSALQNLGIKKSFFGTKAVIQQMEGTEGGLSDLEKRALRDIAESAGADKVYIVETEMEMSEQEALLLIEQNQR